MTPTPLQLNSYQLQVAEAPASARAVIIAGAGQGKTEVVASRIAFLAHEEELSPTDEILVLSFSRAAVEAVRRRLADREVAAVNVRTFDSFAARLLIALGIERSMGDSFDARVTAAVELIADGKADEELQMIRHLIVDEVQDLVADRARLVAAIISHLDPDAGFTALGDPLQGIYDFTADVAYAPRNVFLELETRYGATERPLGPNYRARGRIPREVVSLGVELRELRHSTAAEMQVDNFMDRLMILTIDDMVESVRSSTTKTAILCRSNADALRVSSKLRGEHIPHQLRRRSDEIGPSRWIAQSLSSTNGISIHRDDLEAEIRRQDTGMDPEDAWYSLKELDGSRHNMQELNLQRIRALVRANALPLTMTDPSPSSLIVSTIHRAKGLEFDRVIIVNPTYQPKDADPWTGVRERYVALSRARDDVFRSSLPDLKGRYMTKVGDRVVEYAFNPKRACTMEFGYHDLDTRRPGSLAGAGETDVQIALAQPGLVGQDVIGWLDVSSSTYSYPSYAMTSQLGAPLGHSSESFGRQFGAIFGRRRSIEDWPLTLEGLTLAAVESMAGEREHTTDAGLGESGFWLVPRIVGLARPIWNKKEVDS